MATTTNYGWDTPDDTDLVKDGAAAIRTLGSSIDTTTKNLNPQTTTGALAYRSATANVNTALPIGTAGQVLTVASGLPSWATPTDQTPLTTKGDVFTFSTVDARLGVGANGTVLTADSAEATGLKWVAAASYTPLPAFRAQPTSGQLISANTWTKLTLGTEIFDTNNKFASGRFTPTVAGYYTFTLHYVMEGGNQVFETAIYKNGSSYDSLYWGSAGYPGRSMTSILYLDSDDYVEMYVKTDLGNQILNTASFFAGLGVRE